MEPKLTAAEWVEKGDGFLREKKFPDAVDCYVRAMTVEVAYQEAVARLKAMAQSGTNSTVLVGKICAIHESAGKLLLAAKLGKAILQGDRYEGGSSESVAAMSAEFFPMVPTGSQTVFRTMADATHGDIDDRACVSGDLTSILAVGNINLKRCTKAFNEGDDKEASHLFLRAQQHFQQAAVIAPKDYALRVGKADLHCLKGEFDEAKGILFEMKAELDVKLL
ncbi:unnamed protein product, partial [marine sediment metagenome]